MIGNQEVIFITTPLFIHELADSNLEIIVNRSAVIELLKHDEELLELFFVLDFSVKKFDVADHIREFVQNKGEARDSSE